MDLKIKTIETMTDVNKVTARKDNASMGSSFVEVTGELSMRTNATCSSTIRELLHVDGCLETEMTPIHEEAASSTPDDAFTELCATCLHSGTKKEATHFCPGCDRRGRYMCGSCLKAHSVWCNKPEHEVQSLSVDRQSDPEYRYNTIEQSERGRPKCRPLDNPDNINSPAVPLQSNTIKENVQSWLMHKSTDSDSEKSEATLTQLKGNGRNLTEHLTASSLDLSITDGLSLDNTGTTNYRGPKTGRSNSQNHENQYDHYTRCNHETTSHIYCDPTEMLRLPRITNPHRRNVSDPCEWEHISTATARRLNDVYVHKEQNTQDSLAEHTGGHKNAKRVNKKKKSCIIQ